MAEPTTAAQAKEAVYGEIIKQVKGLSQSRSQDGAAEALKNLAEAYAWVTYPNQTH